MPYKDPERRRAYQREWRKLKRAGRTSSSSTLQLPTPFRLQTAREVLELLEEQVNAVRADPALSTLERARCICSLSGVLLRAVETATHEERLIALETVLKMRDKPL